MSDTMCELATENSGKQEDRVLISLDIEDDKLFLLHFIIGTYFGPDLRKRKHSKQQSAFQIQASKILVAADKLSGSLMKRAEVERVYYHILRNVDQSLVIMPRKIRDYFNEKRNDSNGDYPLFVDLYPEELHPETRVRNRFKFIPSIVFINEKVQRFSQVRAREHSKQVLPESMTEKQVQRFSQVFEMQTQNLCLPGHFSVSFRLPGPVHPQEFFGNFGTDGILEGIVMKKLQKQTV